MNDPLSTPAEAVGEVVPAVLRKVGGGQQRGEQAHAAAAVGDGEAAPVGLARQDGGAGGQRRLAGAGVGKKHDPLGVEAGGVPGLELLEGLGGEVEDVCGHCGGGWGTGMVAAVACERIHEARSGGTRRDVAVWVAMCRAAQSQCAARHIATLGSCRVFGMPRHAVHGAGARGGRVGRRRLEEVWPDVKNRRRGKAAARSGWDGGCASWHVRAGRGGAAFNSGCTS